MFTTMKSGSQHLLKLGWSLMFIAVGTFLKDNDVLLARKHRTPCIGKDLRLLQEQF